MSTRFRLLQILMGILSLFALAAWGLAAGQSSYFRSDPKQEISSRFDGFEGPVREIPGERWDQYLLDSRFAVSVQDRSIEVGWDRFHERVQDFLGSSESLGVSLEFDLSRIYSLLGRLASVQGKVTATNGGERVVRPFVDVLVKVGGEWRAIFSYVGSPVGIEKRNQNRTACSCRPCAGCSRAR
jgi:hypothetical protein